MTLTSKSEGLIAHKIKVAIIGNMNNAGFCIMRYLRDLGYDAQLVVYSNDGTGPLAHFSPESDSWDFERWRPYVHRSHISDTIVSTLDRPWSWVFSLRSLLRWIGGKQPQHFPAVSRKSIRKLLSGFDILIGSGVAPAICARAGMRLDIFWPYAMGVEHLESLPFLERFARRGKIARWFAKKAAARQAQGARASRHIFVSDWGMTKSALHRIGATGSNVPIPAVYNGISRVKPTPSAEAARIMREIEDCDFSILMHARLCWVKPVAMTDAEWELDNKNNDWVIVSFADLVRCNPDLKLKLVLFEYGSDVDATKQLCDRLGIADEVIWAKTMMRRDIMEILGKVSVGVGEFYANQKVLWGSTGWEILATGKPLLQGFEFEHEEFEEAFGFPPPPLLKVASAADVHRHLDALIKTPSAGKKLGDEAAVWFNRYNGIGLARKWLDIAMSDGLVSQNDV